MTSKKSGLSAVIAGVIVGLIMLLVVLFIVVLAHDNDDICGPLGRGTGPSGGGRVAPGTKVLPTNPETTNVSSGFGPRNGEFHWGTDFAGERGQPLYAVYDGQIIAAQDTGISGFGGWVIISHVINGQPVETVYGHIDPGHVFVQVGDTVRAGQHIADLGNSGFSTGAHLHFEVKPGGGRLQGGPAGSIDPLPWLEDAVPPPADGTAPPAADERQQMVGNSSPSPAPPGGAGELPATSADIKGEDVAVYGDSLAVGATEKLNEKLPGVRVIAEVGRDFTKGAETVRADIAANKLPKHVVLELGTNNGVEAGEYQQLIADIRAAKPDTAIVVVTTAGDRPWIESTNAAIRQLQGVQIADWANAVKTDPSLLGADAIHPTPQGQDTLVQLITASIGGGAAPQIQSTGIPGCDPVAGGGTIGDVDLSKIPEAYHEPLRRAASVCPEFDMVAFVGKLYLESGFKDTAQSPDNGGGQGAAMGPGQFLQATWNAYGRDWNNDGKTDVFDPADAVPSSMLYNCENLKTIKKAQDEGTVSKTDDLTDMTLAAYQGGVGAVLGAGGMPNVCDINICSGEYVAQARANGEKFRKAGGRRDDSGALRANFAGTSGPAGPNVVEAARQYIGLPYVWGGNGPGSETPGGGFDCSGLTSRAMREGTGGAVQLPRTAAMQWTVGTEIPVDQAQPGDLVFGNWAGGAPGHVAIVTGPGRMIEAPQSGMDVMEADIRSDMKARRVL